MNGTGSDGLSPTPPVALPDPNAYAARVEKAREKAVMLANAQQVHTIDQGGNDVNQARPDEQRDQGVTAGRLAGSASRVAQGAVTGGKIGAAIAVGVEVMEYKDELAGLIEKAKEMQGGLAKLSEGLDMKGMAASFMSRYNVSQEQFQQDLQEVLQEQGAILKDRDSPRPV